MDTTLAEDLQHTATTLQSDSFFFMSPYRSFTTSGCFARFSEPAVGGDDPAGPFQQKLAQAFQNAKNSGIGALRSEILAENKAMQHLAMQCGFVLQKGDDPGTVKLGLQLQNPEPS